MNDEVKREEKNNKLVYILFIIIIILVGLLLYFIFINKEKKECDKCNAPIEEEPKYQLINYANFTFKMPLDWKFINDDSDSGITDTDNSIFISFEVIDESYNMFIQEEYQIDFLENLQTSDNIKIDQIKEYNNCFLYEGTYNNYDYLVVAKGNEKKTILIKTIFSNKSSYDKQRNKIIDFSLSDIN